MQHAYLGQKTAPDRRIATRVFDTCFDANHLSTRMALVDIRAVLERDGFANDIISRIEIALAELFNNIAEHAYRNDGMGEVRCTMGVSGRWMIVEVTDQGGPMPGGEIPEGTLPDLDVSLDQLPEGGFGWFMILAQADTISHHRLALGNCTRLNFDLTSASPEQKGRA